MTQRALRRSKIFYRCCVRRLSFAQLAFCPATCDLLGINNSSARPVHERGGCIRNELYLGLSSRLHSGCTTVHIVTRSLTHCSTPRNRVETNIDRHFTGYVFSSRYHRGQSWIDYGSVNRTGESRYRNLFEDKVQV
jgi:hypothetical protein